LIFRQPIVALTVATIWATAGGELLAQSAPAAEPHVQPGHDETSVFPPVGNPPIVNLGTSPLDAFAPPGSADCEKEYAPLREEAEGRGRLLKDASARHAGPKEACKLIGSYAQAVIKMIGFVESHATACAIPASIADTLKNADKATEALQTKVCNVAQQMQRKGLPAGPVGDFYLRDDVSKRQPVGPVGDFGQGDDLHRQGY
jgi:hypothetical protein